MMNCFQSHCTVSQRMKYKFDIWAENWRKSNVNDPKILEDWLLGRTSDLIPTNTQRIQINHPERPPYRPFSKYQCLPIVDTSTNTAGFGI